MNASLMEIMEIQQVVCIIYFSIDGNVLFQYYKEDGPKAIDTWNLSLFAAALDRIQEAEMVFENNILYIIRGRKGFLLAALERSAPVALVRLNCNIVLATLDKEPRKPTGLTRLFKKRL